jgi:protein tyrosine/serine phosphatase
MSLAPTKPGFDLATPGGRFRTYADYLWNDHAYLRLGFRNAHWISDELVRTNQPWPHQLAAWKAAGIKTIVNLRGGFDASFHALEKDACARLGLELVDFTITSREVPATGCWAPSGSTRPSPTRRSSTASPARTGPGS